MADGKHDLTELCMVGKDSILDPSFTPIPRVFADKRAFLASMVQRLHPMALLILSNLTRHLDIPFERLEVLHSQFAPSGTVLRFIHNPPRPTDEANRKRQALLWVIPTVKPLPYSFQQSVACSFCPLTRK